MSNPESIESIVVSLEHAKALKDAGWPQEGIFWWGEASDNAWLVDDREKSSMSAELYDGFEAVTWKFVAPTASELLDRLPKVVNGEFCIEMYHCKKDGWVFEYTTPSGNGGKSVLVSIADHSLSNAAAACYCFLAEQKLLPPSE